jgi:hypothetical protein
MHRPAILGCLWMAGLLGALTWFDFRDGGTFLIPPFAATLTILVYQPNVSIAQPIAVVCGSLLGAAIRTVLSVLLGFGPGVALLAALTAMIMLPLLRVSHPPGVALAMCPALHCGAWFAILVVLPFTLAAVISCAVQSRLLTSWPRYPARFLVRVSGSLNRSPVPSRLLWSSEIGGFNNVARGEIDERGLSTGAEARTGRVGTSRVGTYGRPDNFVPVFKRAEDVGRSLANQAARCTAGRHWRLAQSETADTGDHAFVGGLNAALNTLPIGM